MKQYETEQRKLIVSLFRADPDRFYTVEEVAEILRGDSDDSMCSVSTIYRLVARLCEEGIVHKHARDGSRKFYYQYVRGKECGEHLHLKCDVCGKIIHMDQDTSTVMLSEVLRKNGFSVDGARTLMPGLCFSCRASQEAERGSKAGKPDGGAV